MGTLAQFHDRLCLKLLPALLQVTTFGRFAIAKERRSIKINTIYSTKLTAIKSTLCFVSTK